MIDANKERLITFTKATIESLKSMLARAEANHYSLQIAALELQIAEVALTALTTEPDFKKLAVELVENLVDCSGADDSAVKQYLNWTEKTCRAAISYPKREA